MKITLGVRPDIKCPKCFTAPKITTGFFGSFLWAKFLNRFEREGGTITCLKCNTKFHVQGKP